MHQNLSGHLDFDLNIFLFLWPQREYEEFKVKINALVATAQKVPDEGWTMQDGTVWPGNNVRDHPGMIQVRTIYCDEFTSNEFLLPSKFVS